jgi:hypothetical protein
MRVVALPVRPCGLAFGHWCEAGRTEQGGQGAPDNAAPARTVTRRTTLTQAIERVGAAHRVGRGPAAQRLGNPLTLCDGPLYFFVTASEQILMAAHTL